MVISRVIIRVAPFRAVITLLITYLLSPLPLQVEGLEDLGFVFYEFKCWIQAAWAVQALNPQTLNPEAPKLIYIYIYADR